MKKLLTLTAIAAITSSTAFAHSLQVGQPLPSVTVEDGGLAAIVDGEVEFNEWSTDAIQDGLILAQAARPEVDELISADFKQKMSTMADAYMIVNADDAPFGAGPFIEGAIAEGKLKTPVSQSVLDDDGVVFDEWDLKESSAMMVVVRNGKVVFAHEGKTTPELEAQALELMK